MSHQTHSDALIDQMIQDGFQSDCCGYSIVSWWIKFRELEAMVDQYMAKYPRSTCEELRHHIEFMLMNVNGLIRMVNRDHPRYAPLQPRQLPAPNDAANRTFDANVDVDNQANRTMNRTNVLGKKVNHYLLSLN